jgi:hypothetical protein
MNNKGQISSIFFFIGMIVVIILIAPILLKLGTEILGKTSTQLSIIGNGNNMSADAVTYTKNKLTGVMDWFVILLFIVDTLALFISAFLIDVYPAFVVIYIFGALALVLTAPYLIVTAEKLYDMEQFSGAGSNNIVQYIPMTQFIMNNFGIVIVMILVITGILIYAKIRFSSVGGGNIY